jgi:hypothetical protein
LEDEVNQSGVDEYTGSSGQDILMAGLASSSKLYGGDGQDLMIGDNYGFETTYELGNRDSAWDQIADVIRGFGEDDVLDLSNLGISDELGLSVVGNDLFDDVGTKIAEFSNFDDGYSLQQLTEDGTIIYSSTA